MSGARRMIVLVLMCVTAFVASVSAAGRQTNLERDLDQAKILYRDGRLDEAVASLRGVIDQLNKLRDQQNRTKQLAEAHLYLGLSYFGARDESAALQNFRQVVALDPGRTLDPEIYSPRVMALFEQARGDVEGARTTEPTQGRPVAPNDEKQPAASSDTGPPLQPGTKVRLHLRLGGETAAVAGTLVARSDQALTLLDADSTRLSFPRETITHVEVSRGRRAHWLLGAVLGAGIGAAVGAFEAPGCDRSGTCYTRGENIGYSAAGIGLIGALAGALYRTDQWVEVSFDRSTVPVTPASNPKMAVSFAWRY